MAIDASGTLYTTVFRPQPVAGDYLVTLVRERGAWIPKVGPRVGDVRALAFARDGTLFAMRTDGMKNQLYTVDTGTGGLRLVGYPGVPGIQALDFGPDGRLYGFDVGDGSGTGVGLVRIDPVTALATDVDPAVDGRAVDVQTLAFAPDGTLYGAHENLFVVDLNTGGLTLVGPIESVPTGIRGMVWIPEPSTLTALATLAAALLLAHLWRKRKR